jgi:hypothetical protein
MTELQKKVFAKKSLKEKLALSKKRLKIETEIANYQEGVKRGSFVSYNQAKVDSLTKELEAL